MRSGARSHGRWRLSAIGALGVGEEKEKKLGATGGGRQFFAYEVPLVGRSELTNLRLLLYNMSDSVETPVLGEETPCAAVAQSEHAEDHEVPSTAGATKGPSESLS